MFARYKGFNTGFSNFIQGGNSHMKRFNVPMDIIYIVMDLNISALLSVVYIFHKYQKL